MAKTLAVLIFCTMGVVPLQAATEARTILVFPFENRSARADLNWISESFAEVLSMALSGPTRWVVDRQERNAAYEHLDIPPGTPLTLASIYKVAEMLGVDWGVAGDFTVEGDRLSARARLLDVSRTRMASPLEVTGELADLVDLQMRLAWRLLAIHAPGFTVGSEEEFRGPFPPVRLDAFENYIRGLLAGDAEARVRFLREADRLNPADHRPALELGRHYFNQKDYGSSAYWLRKLEPKDPNYREGLFLLGVDEFFLGRETAAEKAFAELIQQMPLSEVWNNLGLIRARRGRYAEALPAFERAYRGDPTDPDFCFNFGACLWYLKKYQDAARYLQEALRLASEDPEAHTLLAQVLERLGDVAGKQREFQWLADHDESAAEAIAGELLPNLRLKKNYDGRAFRMLALAVLAVDPENHEARRLIEQTGAGTPAKEKTP